MTHEPVTGPGTAGSQTAGPAAADDAFGMDLYRRPGAGPPNLVFSPASVAAALQMALVGARGSTASQLAAALHLAATDPAKAGGARDGLRLLSTVIAAGQDPALVMRAPNTLWIQSGLPLAPSFTGPLRDVAAAAVHETDFRAAP